MIAPGTRLGNYEIRALLGVGGTAETYLAEDTRLKRAVALKVFLSLPNDESDQLHVLEREACAASALNHPNILTIYEIRQAGSATFIAAEFIESITLRQRRP